MHKNNIPLKVALGYCIIAIIMILAISLVYSNTKSIIAINEASREYIKKKDAADSTMTSLLKEEQKNLKQLSDAMAGKSTSNYLQDKVKSLNTGKDSIVVHSKAPQTHEAKKTTVEVMKTRRGFFRRLADAFKKEHAETLSIKQDSNRAIIDSITTPVNVAENVANILDQIDKKEKVATQDHKESINKEMEDLKIVSTKLALRSAKQLSDVHQRERDSMQKAINKAMAARKQLLWQIGLLTLVTLLAIIVMIWFIWRDARKERIYRENLEAANEEIQRIMNQRERLLLTITHDIKAPAASISGFIDLMKEYVKEAQGIECLQNIKNSAAHLSRLVASLLDYHQLENGLMKVQPVSFSPTQLVKESVEGMRLRAEEKGLAISYEMTMGMKKEANQENETDKELFLADAFRIRQILDNLVNNAIKYTDHGSVNIEARVSKIMGKLTLTMSVKDTGKGMTDEEKRKVFQAFTRLKSAQGIEGTGLGLSITQELVSLLGGEILLRSTLGKGSNFIVTLPIEPAPKDDSQEDIKQTSDHQEAKDSDNKKKAQQEFANHKVLILDDDKLQLQLLQEMLRRIAGDSWQVFACNHVIDALTILHNEQPALMLMDIEMPEMNGTEMITHINHTNMTVIAMTAHDTSIREQLIKAGFDDCLFKPFSIEKLSAILGIDSEPQSHFDALLAFAEGDEEAAKEILNTVKQELAEHLKNLKEAMEEDSLSINKIEKAAHKLLPIASMMQMSCLEELKALSPEHIQENGEEEIRKKLKVVTDCLQHVLEQSF
ncbi:MAG: response regulator [Streptococcus sp.]|jgi:signal transduction histidine kinase/response regulator of citrate/malate metabolism|uniref:hybrid sensor histidine kinase/response regulator n=1 Tax=Segatella copri TaxID=165179 RepID=UPI001D713C71|nr:hybrid sensor histidine kinase/response regulator [Segatella copri]MBN2942517.1 response regulator [Streptococcus sp.]MCW4118470.1 hybrid sensor histidine kinase/response regulator [Segatella copri]